MFNNALESVRGRKQDIICLLTSRERERIRKRKNERKRE